MRLIALVVAGVLVLSGCSVTPSLLPYDPAADAKKMQGSWKLTHARYDGNDLIEDFRLAIDGDQYIGELHGTPEASHFELGTGGRNTIFVKHHDTPAGTYGGSWTGIYELSGDKLRICFDLTGQHYPKMFFAERGSRQTINEFVREH